MHGFDRNLRFTGDIGGRMKEGLTMEEMALLLCGNQSYWWTSYQVLFSITITFPCSPRISTVPPLFVVSAVQGQAKIPNQRSEMSMNFPALSKVVEHDNSNFRTYLHPFN